MFKFLKLRNSVSGDALRHVPFASIIHKHVLPLFLSLILVLFSSAQKVYAVDVPLPPVWLPMNPYNAEGLEDNYVILNDDQKKIAKELVGVYGSVFMGLAANPLQNPLQTVDNVRSWWQEFGDAFLNSIFSNPVWTSSYQNPKAIVDMVGSVTQKASTYNSYSDYVSDTSPSVSSGLEKYMNYAPELTVAFKNWYAVNGNLYDWQKQTKPWESTKQYDYEDVTSDLTPTQQVTFNVYLKAYGNKITRSQYKGFPILSQYMGASSTSANFFDIYTNLFLNTNSHTIYLCDNSGNVAPVSVNLRISALEYNSYNNSYSIRTSDFNNATTQYYYDSSLTPVEAYQSLYNNPSYGNYSTNLLLITYLSDYVLHLYAGTSWQNKQEIYNIDDLNIGASSSAYIDNVGSDAFVDINGLLGYLGNDVVDVRTGVIDNTLVREGDHAVDLTQELLTAIDRVLEQTSSGIIVPSDVFSSLFDNGKGFISYMWYMTKPLVIYTRDLLDLLTFDPVNGFNASGPGYFILGVVGLGVIGGVIVKFLL